MTRRPRLLPRLRVVAMTIVLTVTGVAVQAAPVAPSDDTPDHPFSLPLPFGLGPQTALAAYCASGPSFQGKLTQQLVNSGTPSTAARITSNTVYGWISHVDAAWSCTLYRRYSGLTWNVTSTLGIFDYGTIINSTSVACNWGVGSTDYLKANNTQVCPSTDTSNVLSIQLTKERVYQADASHNGEGDYSFVHSDCATTPYYGAEVQKGSEASPTSFSTGTTNNRPGANCDPIELDSTNTSQTVTYDATVPVGTSISIAGGAAYTTTASVSLGSIAGTDTVAGISSMRFSNNGTAWSGWETYAATRAAAWDLTNATYGGTSADGTKTVYVEFQDANGNGPSAPISDTIVLDRSGPAGSVSVNAGATYTSSTAVTLTVSATDTLSPPVAQMRFSNDGSAWTTYSYATSHSWTLASGSDGTRTVYAQFKDTAGNWSSGTGISDTIVLDASPAIPNPPDVTCAGTAVWQPAVNAACFFRPSAASTLTVTGQATDSVSGVSHIRFENLTPGTNWTPTPSLPNQDTSSPYTETLGFAGSTPSATIDVTARNGAGTDGSTRHVALTADATSPTALIAAPDANRALAGPITITGTATDTQTFMEYQLEYGVGASPASWTSLGTFTSQVSGTGTIGTWSPGTLSGAYTIRLTVRDRVGNSTAVTRLVYLENAGRGEESYVTRVPFDLGGGWVLDVGVANGEMRLSRDLFSIPSYGPAQALSLSYSSAETGAAGRFGTGWTSNLTQYLTFESGFVVWHRADGGRVPFGQVGGTWTAFAGHFETLAAGSGGDAGRYLVTLKDQTTYVFEGSGAGRLVRIDDRFGTSLTIAWSTDGATVTDASGRGPASGQTYNIVYDSGNARITSFIDYAGRAWTFAYTGTDLTSISDPASAVTALGYDGSHHLTTITRSRSRVSGGAETLTWTVGYTSGKATSVIDPIAHASFSDVANTFTYNTGNTVAGLLKTYSPLVRNSTTYAYDTLGRVTALTDAEDNTTAWTYDAASNATAVARPDAGTTTYVYDGRGNITRQTTPIDATTSVITKITYNATNDVLSRWEATGDADTATTADQLVSTYSYDGSGHLTSVNVNCTSSGTTMPVFSSGCSGGGTQDAATNLVTSYAYTTTNQVAFEQDPLGRVTRHDYDTWGNETSTTRNCTSSGTTAPSPFSSCTAGGTADQQTNVVTATTFDQGTSAGKAGLPTSSTDAVGNESDHAYDALGRQTGEALAGDSSIPGLARTTTYDELGNVLTEVESWMPLGGGSAVNRTTSHVYDLSNRETQVTDPAAVVATRAYDAAGDLLTELSGGTTTTRTYDGLGQVITEDANGVSTSYTYNGAGQVTMSSTDGVDHTMTYDLAGRSLSDTEDDGGLGLVTSHAYDRLGREVTTTDANGIVRTTVYDRVGRVVTTIANDVANPSRPDEDVTTSFVYDRGGNQIGTTGPDGKLTTTDYDPLDRAGAHDRQRRREPIRSGPGRHHADGVRRRRQCRRDRRCTRCRDPHLLQRPQPRRPDARQLRR